MNTPIGIGIHCYTLTKHYTSILGIKLFCNIWYSLTSLQGSCAAMCHSRWLLTECHGNHRMLVVEDWHRTEMHEGSIARCLVWGTATIRGTLFGWVKLVKCFTCTHSNIKTFSITWQMSFLQIVNLFTVVNQLVVI